LFEPRRALTQSLREDRGSSVARAGAQYAKLAALREEQQRANQERIERERAEREQAERERNARIAAYQDNVDLGRPGGVLRQPTNGVTREMLQNSRKTTSVRARP
jgi:hypothetical protein